MELTPIERKVEFSSSLRRRLTDLITEEDDEEVKLTWAEIERLPSLQRMKTSLFDVFEEEDNIEDDYGRKQISQRKRIVDVTQLGAVERHVFIEKIILFMVFKTMNSLKLSN